MMQMSRQVYQSRSIDRFYKVRVRTILVCPIYVGVVLRRAQDDYRYPAEFVLPPQPLKDLKAGASWEAKVEQDHRRRGILHPIRVRSFAVEVRDRCIAI